MGKPAKPPAESLLDTVADISRICDTLLDDWNSARENAENSASAVKILTEYRQFLKLRFEVLNKLGGLIEEARFQQALLLALKGVSEDIHEKVVEALYSLQQNWSDQSPASDDDEKKDADDDDDNADDEDDNDGDTPESPPEPHGDVNTVGLFPHDDENLGYKEDNGPDHRDDNKPDNPEKGDVPKEDR